MSDRLWNGVNLTVGRKINHGVYGNISKKEAVEKVVKMAVKQGFTPPKWYEFYKPKWPQWAVDEYNRQLNKES